ncbi:hypothetical protein WMY93_025686 [Mugilogobius chulae]|uniref:Uncharacterized protein n=1 Tax=Mugilogobius chulae TaxID=88201 RepID=A0AAW0MZM0_9GOBI
MCTGLVVSCKYTYSRRVAKKFIQLGQTVGVDVEARVLSLNEKCVGVGVCDGDDRHSSLLALVLLLRMKNNPTSAWRGAGTGRSVGKNWRGVGTGAGCMVRRHGLGTGPSLGKHWRGATAGTGRGDSRLSTLSGSDWTVDHPGWREVSCGGSEADTGEPGAPVVLNNKAGDGSEALQSKLLMHCKTEEMIDQVGCNSNHMDCMYRYSLCKDCKLNCFPLPTYDPTNIVSYTQWEEKTQTENGKPLLFKVTQKANGDHIRESY